MTANQNKFRNATFDGLNATYKHKIILKNGYILTGYSQKAGFNEKADKDHHLINLILRLYSSGYLDENYISPDKTKDKRIEQIEIYLNDKSATAEPHLFNLYYNGFEIVYPDFENNRKVIAFLKKFYEDKKLLRKSQVIDKLQVKERSLVADKMDISKKRFLTKDSLIDYCYRMLDKKQFTKEEADHFYRTYLEKYKI